MGRLRDILLFALVVLNGVFPGLTLHPDTLEERHSIVKRFAEAGQKFTSHEIADVFHEKEPESFHRISKRDLRSITEDGGTVNNIRLDLSSGSTMHLKLRKRSLFDYDTQVYDNTKDGPMKREAPPQDCYATGEVEVNGVTDGLASLAVCDGIHGTAISNVTEYYIHPVENGEEGHQVHILSRRASTDASSDDTVASNDDMPHSLSRISRYKRDSAVTKDTYKTATSFVIELAMFVDAKYYARLTKIAPGREDEYVLMAMAATQAIFSDKQKVGYDASIKIKLYMNWIVDPDGYHFKESIFNNLRSFCQYTRSKYHYDMHFLHTGVTKQQGPAVGVAYLGGVCTNSRCGNTYSTVINRFSLIAHEIGHNIGFNHHGAAKCPDYLKKEGGGFMGGGDGRNFSPCNKWELLDFFSRGKGQCLLEETRNVETSDKYVNIPKVMPGQYQNPDEECKLVAGNDYMLYRPFDFRGSGECAAWMCINRNKESPEYLRVKRRYAMLGFTCGDEMFCDGTKCSSWDNPSIGWSANYLREHKGENSWTEWPGEWSTCSRTCGTGVQLKRRRCNFSDGLFLSPYCRGASVKARLCNKDPCPGDPASVKAIRQAQGDEICSRFHNNNITLHVRKGAKYLPKSRGVWIWDKANRYLETKSCLLMCQRSPSSWNYLDSIFPDGTPCTESKKNTYKRIRYNIDLRCVQGACVEISDCPGNEEKDACGVCGGDSIHCVDKVFDRKDDVAAGERKILATLPSGTTNIDINMRWWVNRGVRMELYSFTGDKLLGRGARYPRTHYRGENLPFFANSTWSYDHGQYIRAAGPIDQELVVKVLRQANPIKNIYVAYLLPEND